MAIGAGAAAAIGAAATIASAGGQMYANAKLNKRAERYNRDMANIQRNWALEDWERQNAYNSPAAQMERYKEAGLNPNLIYGQSNEGASVRSTDIKGVDYKGTDVGTPIAGLGDTFSKYYSLKQQQQALRNTAADEKIKELQQSMLQAQIGNTVAQTAATIAGTDTTKFNLGYMQEMKDINQEILRLSAGKASMDMQKTGVDMQLSINRDLREATMNAASIRQIDATITNLMDQHNMAPLQRDKVKEEINQLKKTGEIKEFERQLLEWNKYMRDHNIPENSPWMLKWWGSIIKKFVPALDTATYPKLDTKNMGGLMKAMDSVKKGW